ncbi:glycosyltransferase family 4 protein [Pedobacter antarcticus]|uniref:glycosyltransferase family 4 protein n=1 Tax=Pedobacter antarcticus TaxID=34086 RepID=UPI00292D30FE|nr:glycosyltransferase family 4 protein [Pedobacter antarcticus]
MKIVIAISHSFCANFIKGQSAYLQSKGHNVTIVSASGPEVTAVANNENANLVEIPFSREISLVDDIKGLFSVIKFLRTEKPDIVNAGNPKTGFLFMLASIFFPKIPMIFTLRGLRSDTLSGIKGKIVFFTEWLSCYLAKKVIVISPSLRDHAVEIGVLNPKKAIVLGKGSSNGVDIDKFCDTDQNILLGKELRSRFEIKQNDFVVGHVGRITKDKGVEELFDAFKLSRLKHRNLKLVLAGPVEDDDPIKPEVMEEMLLDKDVVFLGKVDNVAGVYCAYDVLVLYSYREGFGNVVIEASSMGKPVIVSDIPGARDTTEHMMSGIHVEPRNSHKLSEAINLYIENEDLRKSHGKYGQRRAQQYFSSDVIWEGQHNLYKSLVKP